MSNFTGQGGSVTYNAVPYSVKEFSFEGAAEGVNTTSTGSGGFGTVIAAPRKGSGTFTIIVDAAAMPAIQEGSIAAAVFALGGPGGVSAGSITCTSILINKVGLKNPSEEDVEMECSFMTSGSYSYSFA